MGGKAGVVWGTPQGVPHRAERSEAKSPLSLGRRGYDLRKNLLIALRNQKRGIARALIVFVASQG